MSTIENEVDTEHHTPPSLIDIKHIILFYKYHPLSSSFELMEQFRCALEQLCTELKLKGRILIGCSDDSEGINGTLAGNFLEVKAFTLALLGKDFVDAIQRGRRQPEQVDEKEMESILSQFRPTIESFWKRNEEFALSICKPVLRMNSPADFKWSSHKTCDGDRLFPDLNIKLVNEMIGTGGVFSSITVDETSKGYLTPNEWHDELLKVSSKAIDGKQDDGNDTILIDCRNTKECSIGKFDGAIDPKTTTFAQFPRWVKQNEGSLKHKRILMYCTGGIRCEKASAFIRNTIPEVKDVKHLKGGIHKYIEEYSNDGFWKGKNFVFHGGLNNDTEKMTDRNDDVIIGQCIYCHSPHDTFQPGCLCTVCREPVLVCSSCRNKYIEYHCFQHEHLRSCYFSNLSSFTKDELNSQLQELEEKHLKPILVGKKFKQKRRTIQKQCNKIRQRLNEVDDNNGADVLYASNVCRSCGTGDCSGLCWGFHSLKRKEILELNRSTNSMKEKEKKQRCSDGKPVKKEMARPTRQRSNHRVSKQLQRSSAIEEIQRLSLSSPPCQHRNPETSIRIPPPCTRVLSTSVKGKWCGKSIVSVVQNEFADLAQESVLRNILDNGLLRVNGIPVPVKNDIDNALMLKNMDIISRIVHWHEPPVIVPSLIHVRKISLPSIVQEEYQIKSSTADPMPDGSNEVNCDDKDANLFNDLIYVCDKPSSVPVHPAGQYLSNTLTLMVEAQENLNPRTLIPCHRIDRVTSGLTLCCTNVAIARLLQSKIDEGVVKKLYVAKVKGKFPQAEEEFQPMREKITVDENFPAVITKLVWHENKGCVEVNAPIENVDVTNGIRAISAGGKSSTSRFQYLSYNQENDSSLIACCPLTGRGHQLRVHLQCLGFPIENDVQYGWSCNNDKEENDRSKEAIQAMINSFDNEVISEDSNESLFSTTTSNKIATKDVKSARSVCRCCKDKNGDGIQESFTPAQLLQSGYAIKLHAYRYSIPVARKRIKAKKKNKLLGVENNDASSVIAVIDLNVDLPDWAEPFAGINTDNISWLQD